MRSGEWVANVRVSAGGELSGVTIPAEAIPTLIDELPLLACIAAYAEGRNARHRCRRAAREGERSHRRGRHEPAGARRRRRRAA